MSDTTDTTPTTDATTGGSATEATALHASRAECEANKPSDAPKSAKPMLIAKNGTPVGWLWAIGYSDALATIARRDGYSASTGQPKAAVTVEAAAAKLATLSDAELAALGLKRQPQKSKK